MTKQIHLINPLLNLNGGSEQRSIALAELLAKSPAIEEVVIWHKRDTNPERLWTNNKIKARRIEDDKRNLSLDGNHIVYIGFYHMPSNWMLKSHPSRLTIVVNTDPRQFSFARTVALLSQIQCKLEFCYASSWIRNLVGVAGKVQISPINIQHFQPVDFQPNRKFTVGRLSRDVIEKHHPEDKSLYQKLAAQGICIRVLGGTVLCDSLPGTIGFSSGCIEIMQEGAELSNEFLRSLDCFYYRTHPRWIEAHGRVITEAMSTGIPVVAHRNGGYAEFIKHGVNGFLFETTDDAQKLITKLSKDTNLCSYIGKNARHTMMNMFGDDSLKKVCSYYEYRSG